MQTIFPIPGYHDARAAIRRPGSAFGFVRLFPVPESGNYVRHAQQKPGKNLIMAGWVEAERWNCTSQGAGLVDADVRGVG